MIRVEETIEEYDLQSNPTSLKRSESKAAKTLPTACLTEDYPGKSLTAGRRMMPLDALSQASSLEIGAEKRVKPMISMNLREVFEGELFLSYS